MDIKGKISIVTGASKGIGKAIALALAEEGSHVAVSARNHESLHQTAESITALGVECLAFTGDMASESSITAFIDATITRFGRLDVLVNNAGVGHFHNIADMPTNEWDAMFNLNVRGMFIATRRAIPHLRRSGDSFVVNIASLAGKNAFAGGGGYAASKHAVLAFSRCLMLEERNNGIHVVAICPGSVNTAFFDSHRDISRARTENMLLPEDVASSVLHAIRMPGRAMVSEIDIRPSMPR
ncbi:MAG: SDR family NAD(P)-dependent oxidoreductase [Chlorobi bacterium]|nr:SDR family NAD(P)-dependent oxidoreductase [Chlorobiota bacterium]